MKTILKISLMFIFSIISLVVSIAADNQTTHPAALNPEQTAQIQKVIHDYLLQNPQIVIEALQVFQQKQRIQIVQETERAIRSHAKELLMVTPHTPVAGNPNGKVTLVEFFDYQCTHCKKIAPAISALIQKIPQLRVIYKDLPGYPNSNYIAAASLASLNQDKYSAFHEALFKAGIPISKEEVIRVAKEVGMDISKLKTDMEDNKILTSLKNNVNLANNIYIAGTPSFIILSNTKNSQDMNIYFVPGEVPEAVLEKDIHEALKKAD